MNTETQNYESERKILDSGNRREFASGAVRDIAEGKGRCDLLPLDCVSLFFKYLVKPEANYNFRKADACNSILTFLSEVVRGRDVEKSIPICINSFMEVAFEDKPGYALMELAKHYEQGAIKYKERNWEMGIPTHCYVDSCVRHLLKWYDGWDDEPHDRAVLWNLFGLWWTLRNKPEMNDLPWDKDGENNDKC